MVRPGKCFALFPLLCLLVLSPLPSLAQSVVNCNAPEAPNSIQAELNAGTTDIRFTGVCNEFVEIFQDRTVIVGASPSASVIAGGLGVRGADRVFLDNLKIGGGQGVFIREGSSVTMQNSVVENTKFGFVIRDNSSVVLDGNMLAPASDDTAAGCGPLCVLDASSARLTNNRITGNVDNIAVGGALTALRGSYLALRGGNIITNTGTQPAIGIYHQSGFRQDNPTARGPAAIVGGISANGMSYVDVREATIDGDVRLDLRSVFRMGSPIAGGDSAQNTINGDIIGRRASSIVIENPEVTINGIVSCADKTTRATGAFQGAGRYENCRDFSDKKSKNDGGG